MKNWVNLEIDLLIMPLEDLNALLRIAIRQQQYDQAALIKDYIKHLAAIEKEL